MLQEDQKRKLNIKKQNKTTMKLSNLSFISNRKEIQKANSDNKYFFFFKLLSSLIWSMTANAEGFEEHSPFLQR